MPAEKMATKMSRHLEPAELQDVLRRATEIASGVGHGLDVEDYVSAAKEAGIPEEAMRQALQERLAAVEATTALPEHGELVFASNGEGWYCPAKLESTGPSTARVKFLGGGAVELPLSEIQPMNLAPGKKVHVRYWGSWTQMELVSFDMDSRTIVADYSWTKETFPLESVRLKDRRKEMPIPEQLKYWLYGSAIFLSGGIAGAILLRILTR